MKKSTKKYSKTRNNNDKKSLKGGSRLKLSKLPNKRQRKLKRHSKGRQIRSNLQPAQQTPLIQIIAKIKVFFPCLEM